MDAPIPLLDVAQVGELLHIPVRAVYLLAEEGKLSHYKIGRRLRFDRQSVERFLEESARRAEP